jgi:lipocalin
MDKKTPVALETVAFVDLKRYGGVWYEIARYQIAFRRVAWEAGRRTSCKMTLGFLC